LGALLSSRPVALITGAGSGIGREIARVLSGVGYACALVGRREHALRETGAMLSMPWLAIVSDLSEPGEASRIVDVCAAHFGGVHALIQNAGWSPAQLIGQTSPSDVEAVYALNATAPAASVARAWREFARLRSAGDSRPMCVVNISSLGTIDPFDVLWAYASAKASVNVLAHCVAEQGKQLGVRGFAVAPGAVETELLRAIVSADQLPPEAALSPEEVAGVVRDCVVGALDAHNGSTLFVDRTRGRWQKRVGE
jgi:NAD(P)-dependent dehydrogenase (short-subunit alcohol dehydrogenase family)